MIKLIIKFDNSFIREQNYSNTSILPLRATSTLASTNENKQKQHNSRSSIFLNFERLSMLSEYTSKLQALIREKIDTDASIRNKSVLVSNEGDRGKMNVRICSLSN
jgi:predicted NAD/FAD-binding protein